MKLTSSFSYGITLNAIIAIVSANVTVTMEDLGVRAERAANLSHITGVSRKIQIYIKNRFLQILPDGTVNGSNSDVSNYTIFQRISVFRGQLKIQALITCFYLCMNSSGLLYGSKIYTNECLFNETLEQHNYNTYSSVRWSLGQKTLYVGLNRYGNPRRVQVKRHKLGRLSSYARVLTRVVSIDIIKSLYKNISLYNQSLRNYFYKNYNITNSNEEAELFLENYHHNICSFKYANYKIDTKP